MLILQSRVGIPGRKILLGDFPSAETLSRLSCDSSNLKIPRDASLQIVDEKREQKIDQENLTDQFSLSPNPRSLTTSILLSTSMSLTILYTLHKWNHAVFAPL